ncbi:hypothetical protein APICC_07418 [Apis cerana cerana]|uniref:Hornerin-like n=1 Tax=Apis cerana cerana TaxID=94128 RepID=A0A2A3EKZ3_APICC|nr:hypothetical protein APICC_07418 [Apis cerana cerana]
MSGFIRTFHFPTFVLLFATFVAGSGAYEGNVGSLSYSSASANAYSSSGTAGAFIGNEGHKGIRSYDTSGGHNQPNGGGGHQDGGCKWSKCKWENDDYWEKDEEETEPEEEDEDECYDGDDGQYKVHDHRQKSKGGSPPGVQKLGAPNPFNGQQSYTGSGAPFGTVTPSVSGHSQTTGTHGSQQPFNQQPGSNQRYDGPTPGTGSHPLAWNSAPGSWSNADVSTDKNGPKTGFGCAGNYQRETGCAQGSSGAPPVKQALLPFPGIEGVQKESSPGYFGSPASGCSGSPYEKCIDKSGSQPTRYDTLPDTEQGRYPGSPQNVPYGPQYSASKPSENNIGPYPLQNAANSHIGTSLDSGAGRTPIFGSTDSSPIGSNGSPFGTAQTSGSPSDNAPRVTQKPGYSSVKGSSGSRTNASKDGDSKIFYINVNPASGKPEGYKPSNADEKTQPFYQPNYSATGTTKPSYQPNSHDNAQTTKPYQPASYDGKTQPSYQPASNFGTTKPNVYGGTTKSSYQPSPYSGIGTTKPSYQPGPYNDFGTTKPAYQPTSYSGTGTTKPSYQPSPYSDETKSPSGCQSGSRGCENRSGCSSQTNGKSPDSCGQPGVSVDISKISGPIVGSDAYSNDFSQSSQKITPGTNGQLFNGSPIGGGSSPYNCVSGTDCVSGPGSPSYVPNKFDKTNKIVEGGGSYPSNPFLTGKIPIPEIGGPIVTSTSKPIGHGNPFLQGNVGAISGAWSHSIGGAVAHPSGGNKNVVSIEEESTRPIGKDNPFLHGSGSARGDIGINDKTTGESDSLIPAIDRTYAGPGQTSGSPVSHYPGLTNDGSSSATKNPPGTNRGSGSGGGIGIDSTGFGILPGSFANSQASTYANSGSYSGSGAPSFGQANSGSWASSGANAASWSSSSASAYASSNAGSWSGGQPSHVKG